MEILKNLGHLQKDKKSEDKTAVHNFVVLGELGTLVFALASIPGTHRTGCNRHIVNSGLVKQ
jgi:hypothetical protein